MSKIINQILEFTNKAKLILKDQILIKVCLQEYKKISRNLNQVKVIKHNY